MFEWSVKCHIKNPLAEHGSSHLPQDSIHLRLLFALRPWFYPPLQEVELGPAEPDCMY